MPTTRKRLKRRANGRITQDIIDKFRRWKELDDRRGLAMSKEGILLTDEEQSEYYGLGSQLYDWYGARPWEQSPFYRMYGVAEHPSPDNLPNGDTWDRWSRPVEMRKHLESLI